MLVTIAACGLGASGCFGRPSSFASRETAAATARSPGRFQTTAVVLGVPAPPVPVRAAGHVVLVYELHVSNVGSRPLRLERVDVLDADHAGAAPVGTYGRSELEHNDKLIAPRGTPAPKEVGPGVRAVVYVWLPFDSSAVLPRALTHHVVFADGRAADGATVLVRPPTDLVLASPVGAGDWWIGLGPSNTSDHRRSAIRVGEDTVPHLAQRFAIDFVKLDARGEFARDGRGRRNSDWYGYGEPVLAAADARVAEVMDTIPENVPGEGSRAIPMRVATVLGNYVLLDLGASGDAASGAVHRYALYAHLQPGSVRVRVGEVVRRGQPLGAIGNSGNSDGPHLHFHVTEATDVAVAALRSEGVPFMLDTFTVVAHDPDRVAQHASLTALGAHGRALPVEGDVIRPSATRP